LVALQGLLVVIILHWNPQKAFDLISFLPA
jgi:hypothetical protein